MPDGRLDVELAARGLARSRTQAARLIEQGLVTVDGRAVVKASARVGDASELAIASPDHYVSRAAHKLVAALDAFGIVPAGRVALDAGASTGGFTQVLLERGARAVLAVDVGHGQLDAAIASDARVRAVEGYNLRYATPETLAAAAGEGWRPDLVAADLSFISLRTVLPALRAVAAEGADFVLLVKPQFEVGRGGIREGIVHSARLREDAVAGVLWAGWDLGLGTAGAIRSPIAGGHGNREYLVHLRASGAEHPTEWLQKIAVMAEA